eukprot:1984056-Pleurochrysis_carterae.AAC.1
MDPPPEAPTTFSFHPLHPLASLHTSRAKELLNKWNLDVHGRSYVFRFDQHFTQGQSQAFLNDFFNDPQVGMRFTSGFIADALIDSAKTYILPCPNRFKNLFQSAKAAAIGVRWA